MIYFTPARRQSVLQQGRLVAERFARMALVEQAEAQGRLQVGGRGVHARGGAQGGVHGCAVYLTTAARVAQAMHVEVKVHMRVLPGWAGLTW